MSEEDNIEIKDNNSEKKSGNKTEKKTGIYIYRGISTVIIAVFAVWFFTHLHELCDIKDAAGNIVGMNKKYVAAVILFTAAGFAAVWIKNFLSDKLNRILAFFICLALPLVLMRMMDFTIDVNFAGAMYNHKLNLFVMFGGLLLAVTLTNSLKAGSIITMALCVIFSIANYYTYIFRGNPIMMADVFTMKTAANVAGQFTFTVPFRVFLVAFAGVIFILAMLRVRNTRVLRWKFWPILLVFMLLYEGAVTKTVVLPRGQMDQAYIKMFNPMWSYKRFGTALIFTRSIHYIYAEKPDGYSVEEVKKIMDRYDYGDLDSSDTGADTPNVITIVSEAFSDMKFAIHDLQTNEDYMPFYHSLSQDCHKGKAYVSVRGGQTANTEFEYLTGNSMAFLPEGSVPFQIYINSPMPSFIRQMKQEGYQGNNGYHPFDPTGYRRDVVYPFMGFSHFYSESYFQNPARIGAYISDRSLFETLTADYEKLHAASDAPIDMYTMTMQNHSPYKRDFTGLNYRIHITGEGQNSTSQENYLNLIRESDDALQYIIDYFKKVDDKTIIVFFGDHQQRISSKYIRNNTDGGNKWEGEDQMKNRYCVPYLIWANYDIDEVNEDVSVNYLSTIVTDLAGEEKTGYQQFLTECRKHVPVICALGYIGDNGKYYSLDDTKSPYYSWIRDYSYLNYNNTFDKKNRVTEFFAGQKSIK